MTSWIRFFTDNRALSRILMSDERAIQFVTAYYRDEINDGPDEQQQQQQQQQQQTILGHFGFVFELDFSFSTRDGETE